MSVVPPGGQISDEAKVCLEQMIKTSPSFWSGRRVLVTGHMGFKGSWLTYVLSRFGAHTVGFGVDERPDPLLYRMLSITHHECIVSDVNDLERLREVITAYRIEAVFHLAAQSIVIDAYNNPLQTFQDNIMGTATLMEALRTCDCVKVAVMVTSDKVYANKEWVWPYREDEPLGGHDPYSASKAAAEIVIQAMRASFFGPEIIAPRVASVRAGNVIGGGDWAKYRLLPDAARAYSAGETLIVRNPEATRPWQHVLDPLAGYLLVAQTMFEGNDAARFSAWNFGPQIEDALSVREVVECFSLAWGAGANWALRDPSAEQPHEATFLSVDSSRARKYLNWAPRWRVGEAIERTARWYRDFYAGGDPAVLMNRDIEAYFD